MFACQDADAAGQQAAVARRATVLPDRRSSSGSSALPPGATRPTSWGRRAAPSACARCSTARVPFARFADRAHARALGTDDEALTAGRRGDQAAATGHPPRRASSAWRPAASASRRISSRAPCGPPGPQSVAPEVGGPAAAAPPATEPARRIDRREQSERAFLSLCVALPELGEEKLGRPPTSTPLFTAPLTRLAAERLRGHLAHPASVIGDAPELAELIPEIVLRAGQLDATPATLELEALQLDLHRLDREITAARTGGEGAIGALATERQKVLDAIRHRLQ